MNVVLPRWNASTNLFADGSALINQSFVNLVQTFGQLGENSAALDGANPAFSPNEDILGNIRTNPDLGAVEFLVLCETVAVNN
ncbi:MAG: hypothetical protein HKN76_00690 [Saprospiraceae bacterium]|nr:hypothetical protein [Saprospiraceae bacterium]